MLESSPLHNKFQEDIGRSKRMIKGIKEEIEETITEINKLIELKGVDIESTKTAMEAIDCETKTNTSRRV